MRRVGGFAPRASASFRTVKTPDYLRHVRRERLLGASFSVIAALLAGASLPSAALAACDPPGDTPAGTNTYSTGNNNVTCDDAHPPIADSMVNLNQGDDRLTGEGNPVYSNGGFLRQSNQIYFDTPNPTGGAQIVVLNGAIGNDAITLNGGDLHGQVQGNDGDDVITINNATVHGAVLGDGLAPAGTVGSVTSGISTGNDVVIIQGDSTVFGNVTLGSTGNQMNNTSQQDRAFMYGSDVKGEFQNGPGTDYTFLFGGTIEDSVEMQRGSINSVIVLDGADIDHFETQGGNANFLAGINPTFYLRSGSVGSEQDEIWDGSTAPSTWIIDPINSVDPNSISPFATDIAAELANAAPNPNPDHLLTISATPNDDFPNGVVAFGNGDANVNFVGADNMSSHPNLLLTSGGDDDDDDLVTAAASPQQADDDDDDDEGGIPTFDGDDPNGGTPSANDVLNVTGGSKLQLADVINFEYLNVTGKSLLALSSDDYAFGDLYPGAVHIGSGSTLWLQGKKVEFSTDHFELDGPAGNASFTPSSQYGSFDPGAMLKIGGAPQADEDDDAKAADDDDDDTSISTSKVTINTPDDTFATAGMINMINGLAGDRLTINGPYEANSANLAIDTNLGDSHSKTDKLKINGPIAGTTTIYVNDSSDKGGDFTGHGKNDGIQVVSAPDGLSANNFRLGVNAGTGQREVLGGAFSYRLATTNDAAYLQSDILDQVGGYVAASSVATYHAYAGLETLYQRMGELRRGPQTPPPSPDSQGVWKPDVAWVRGNFSNYNVDVNKGFDFNSDTDGVLFGFDPSINWGSATLHIGVMGGYNSTNSDVTGRTWGAPLRSTVDVDGWSFGGYMTYFQTRDPAAGFYADAVIKYDNLNFDITSKTRPAHGTTDGDAITASGEVGYGYRLGGGSWSLQPQLQLTQLLIDTNAFVDSAPYRLLVNPDRADSMVGRAGLQLQDNILTSGGTLVTPYVIANVLTEFRGDNHTIIAGSVFQEDIDGTWGTVGGGATATLPGGFSFYGTTEYKFGDVQGWGGTVGVKAFW